MGRRLRSSTIDSSQPRSSHPVLFFQKIAADKNYEKPG